MRWTLLLFATLALLATPTALGQDTVDITITVPEQCPDTTFCFEVSEGNVADITAGDEVTITLVNEDNVPHDVHVTEADEADVGGDTDPEVAFANTETIEGGQEDTVTFEAPADGEELYFWCDEIGHEEGGMYIEGAPNDAPFPTLPALLVISLAAALIRQR